MTLSEKFGRRDFLKTTAAAAAAFTIVPRHVLGGPRHIAPSDKVNIAGIGVGGMGGNNLKALETENIVAICDVDPLNHAARVIARYPKAKVYTDYRKMLELQKDIDAVVIATPDHTHALITMAAMKAGKHVYCQKPLAHNVADARAIAKAAAEMNVVTQMGIQGRSGDGVRIISEWIWGGVIGDVHEVDAWCSDSYFKGMSTRPDPKKSPSPWMPAANELRPPEGTPLPKGMDWDLWIGPARMRPYHPVYHPGKWRSWLEFGTGWMCDRGVHTFDPVVWPLKLGAPLTIDATCLGENEERHCVSAIITYKFAAREGMPPVKVTWYEGTRPPRPEDLEDGRQLDKTGGVIYKGTKGTIICGVYGESPRIIPEEKMKALRDSLPAPSLPRIPGGMTGGHEQEFVRAIREGRKANASFEYSGPLTETCLLGNVAKRVDTRIHWDAEKMLVTNVAAANQYLREEYRKGWSL